MIDLFNYRRREASPVQVGDIQLGGDAPIRVQSMTTTNTNDTEACVAQAERIIKAGGELVRLTTQGRREAENLQNINAQLRADGYTTPLVADVHFNANVADVAALYAEKVRVNPGNYVDPARVFKKIEYTDAEYADELKKLEDRFVPFLNICREHHTAVRIGVNHGSLSDRIMSRYGDTPEGIVESCMEFLRICKKEQFDNVVISIKASNTVIMVRTVRLLITEMDNADMHYPLHLGVTEAGTYTMGTIKSAIGIGGLLAQGVGDTFRVTLTADPADEIVVAKQILKAIGLRKDGPELIACPTCGRTRIDLIPLAQEVEKRLEGCTKPITVAVMGCAVNGPGEAAAADCGIAGGNGEGLLFRHGKVLKKVPQEILVDELMKLIDEL